MILTPPDTLLALSHPSQTGYAMMMYVCMYVCMYVTPRNG